jgi:hypothetical protein
MNGTFNDNIIIGIAQHNGLNVCGFLLFLKFRNNPKHIEGFNYGTKCKCYITRD